MDFLGIVAGLIMFVQLAEAVGLSIAGQPVPAELWHGVMGCGVIVLLAVACFIHGYYRIDPYN